MILPLKRVVICSSLLLTLFSELDGVVVSEPILTIGQGKIKGKIGESRNGRNIVNYLGIPYLKKPVRFQEGEPAPKWDDVRDGTKFGAICSQFDRKSKTVVGNEDCLYLNVYTPGIPVSSGTTTGPRILKKGPVIVHIHGGSFVSQSSDLFGPNYLLDEDIILVTFNYRLSVLGFFSTGDKEVTANLGLRDQIQALKWVQQNIEAFGGDPNRVTLFGGGSAGGAMASYLMLSPLSKGLFSGVISTSGNALCPWAIVHNPRKIAEKLATKLNCPTTNSKDTVACIKSKSIKDIEIARIALQGFNEDPAFPFAPVVESWLSKDPSKAVIPEQPEKLISEGKYDRVPWLTGVNSLNGINLGVASIITTPKRLTQFDREWTKLAPITFHFSQTAQNPSNVSDSIRENYFGSKGINEETKDKLILALTDRNFIHCTAKAASIQAKFSSVFLYYLNYIGASSFLDDWELKDKLNVTGVVRGDELQHLFNLKLGKFPVLKKGDKHYPFSDKMVKLWATFSQTGKPMEMTEKAGAEWTQVPANTGKHGVMWYNLDSPSLSRQLIFDGTKQSTLWDELDLGGYKSTDSNNNKFTIGYEMPKSTQKPAPIALTKATQAPSVVPTVPGVTPPKPLSSVGHKDEAGPVVL